MPTITKYLSDSRIKSTNTLDDNLGELSHEVINRKQLPTIVSTEPLVLAVLYTVLDQFYSLHLSGEQSLTLVVSP